MAVNFTIQAEVVDIRTDTPTSDDSFLVDTNVWYWMSYTRASLAKYPPESYQTKEYPTYMSKALGASSKLLWCGLSLSELAHIIERCEREIYVRSGGATSSKEYRHNFPSERANVVGEIQAAWAQVESMASPVDIGANEAATKAALNRIAAHAIDGYDAFMLDAIIKSGIAQIITDDGDYSTVPGIRVFTGNPIVIAAATAQGKLKVR